MSEEDFGEFGSSDEESSSPLKSLFDQASVMVRKRASNLGKEDLLYLYARFKYANEGECNVERPGGIFNFEAKSKWDSWKALDKVSNMSRERAMEEYVAKVDSLIPNWRNPSATESISKADESGTFGIKMSVMSQSSEDFINDADKTCFDLVKEGSLDKLKLCFTQKKCQIDQKDENEMSLLMWACDRGHLEVAKYLIELGADVNKQDADGQTCLHYASACDYKEIVQALLNAKADANIEDSDGQKPIELTQNKEIIQLLNKI